MSKEPNKEPKKSSGSETATKAFGHLARLVSEAGIRLHAGNNREEKSTALAADHALLRQEPEDPDRIFADAMSGVARIEWKPGPAHAGSVPAPPDFQDPEVLDERLFHAAVEGDATPPILEHPEYIEGWVGVAGQRFLPQLRSGVYSIQGSIDLHGLSRIEAREAVEDFILRMARERSCCVKIVHGRGMNSPSDKAVLKECLQRWLATRRMSRCVVAYASAPYTDGGVGAIYVLLRRIVPVRM